MSSLRRPSASAARPSGSESSAIGTAYAASASPTASSPAPVRAWISGSSGAMSPSRAESMATAPIGDRGDRPATAGLGGGDAHPAALCALDAQLRTSLPAMMLTGTSASQNQRAAPGETR